MKNSKLLLVSGLLTLVLLTNRFAGASYAEKNEANVYKQIENQMPYPEFAKNENVKGKVIVEFKFDEKGKIQIMNMNYSNSKLKNYVADRLSKMNIQLSDNSINNIYRVEFSFNLL